MLIICSADSTFCPPLSESQQPAKAAAPHWPGSYSGPASFLHNHRKGCTEESSLFRFPAGGSTVRKKSETDSEETDRLLAQGKDRYDRIQEMINPDGTNTQGVVKDEAEALSILREVGRRHWDIVNGKTDGNGCTVWSALYNLTDKTVTWVSNEQFDNENAVFHFSL